tara:strand:+ start:729 stop:986 length:258 start_codon:yes stop_codon:yes gene_type:complete
MCVASPRALRLCSEVKCGKSCAIEAAIEAAAALTPEALAPEALAPPGAWAAEAWVEEALEEEAWEEGAWAAVPLSGGAWCALLDG